MSTQDRSFTRRRFIQASLGGSAALLGLPRFGSSEGAERPPNFVVIFVDDLGYGDVGCFGAPSIKTPRLDAMASEGVKFTDFYAAAPVCTPSRAALMTGCYPCRVSLPSVLHPNSNVGLNPDEITIAELLKTRGYATACIGKWHLGDLPAFLPTRHGFDYYYGIPYSNDMVRDGNKVPLMRDERVIERPVFQDDLTERYTQEAINFITENKDRPFFVYLPHTFPHVPLHVTERFKGKSKGGLYGDVVECLDWSTGEILDTLKTLGLDDNTLVVFTSDNGPWLQLREHGGSAGPLRNGKGTTWEGGMREPCIVRWPGRIPAGTMCSEMATTMDLYPTLAKLAGADMPTDRIIDGKDIWPLISGVDGAKTPHEAFFYYWKNELHAVRSGRWKLVLDHKKPRTDIDVPPALYDLKSDIGEQNDLSARYPKLVSKLQELAERARADLGDAVTGRPPTNQRPPGKA